MTKWLVIRLPWAEIGDMVEMAHASTASGIDTIRVSPGGGIAIGKGVAIVGYVGKQPPAVRWLRDTDALERAPGGGWVWSEDEVRALLRRPEWHDPDADGARVALSGLADVVVIP